MVILRARVLKYGLVSRKEKDSRSAVFCIPKGYEAAGAALRDRFIATLCFNALDLKTIQQKTQSLLRHRVKGA